jgi:hypothetical protein
MKVKSKVKDGDDKVKSKTKIDREDDGDVKVKTKVKKDK